MSSRLLECVCDGVWLAIVNEVVSWLSLFTDWGHPSRGNPPLVRGHVLILALYVRVQLRETAEALPAGRVLLFIDGTKNNEIANQFVE